MDRITTGNILGFSHSSAISQERMKAVKNYIPHPNESLAIFHDQYGYLGVARTDMEPIGLNKQLGENEYWTFDTVGDVFSLKHVYSGLYMGCHNNVGDQPKLIKHRQRGELFSFSVQPSGLVTINNMNGYHLSCKGGELKWVVTKTTNDECWRFIAPYNPSYYLNNRIKVTGLAMPPSGTLLAVAHCKGGYLGGSSDIDRAIAVVGKLNETEKFVFEKINNTFALKQKLTGHYIGRTKQLGLQVGFASKRDSFETFTLVDEGNGLFTIINEDGLMLSSRAGEVRWSNIANEDTLWSFEACSVSAINTLPVISRVAEPLDGQAYYLLNLNGQNVGGCSLVSDPLRLVEERNEGSRWIFKQEGNTFFLKQALTGLYLGFSNEAGKKVCLASKASENERIRLERKGEGLFTIKNLHGLTLAIYKDYLVWDDEDCEPYLWTFEISKNGLTLHNMAGNIFGLRSATGGFIGGVKNGTLIVVDRLQSWEHFIVENLGDKFSLKQVASGLYVGFGSKEGEKLSLVSHRLGAEQFQLIPCGGNLLAIMNLHGMFFAKKGDHELELSPIKDRWEFCPVAPDDRRDISLQLTMRLVESVFGKQQQPSYIRQFQSSLSKLKQNAEALRSGSELLRTRPAP